MIGNKTDEFLKEMILDNYGKINIIKLILNLKYSKKIESECELSLDCLFSDSYINHCNISRPIDQYKCNKENSVSIELSRDSSNRLDNEESKRKHLLYFDGLIKTGNKYIISITRSYPTIKKALRSINKINSFLSIEMKYFNKITKIPISLLSVSMDTSNHEVIVNYDIKFYVPSVNVTLDDIIVINLKI